MRGETEAKFAKFAVYHFISHLLFSYLLLEENKLPKLLIFTVIGKSDGAFIMHQQQGSMFFWMKVNIFAA